jgi:hypothetical protein
VLVDAGDGELTVTVRGGPDEVVDPVDPVDVDPVDPVDRSGPRVGEEAGQGGVEDEG